MEPIRIVSVNISKQKGTVKEPVDVVELNDKGIVSDAHAGSWHRQVSLLGLESIGKMQQAFGRPYHYGEFAENITTSGYPLFSMHPLDRLTNGDLELQVTQIGKKCHGDNCAIFRQTGDCVMPREGIFCRVIRGGMLKPGDELIYEPKTLSIKIVTLSDRAHSGEYADVSGPAIHEMMRKYLETTGRPVSFELKIIPDEANVLKELVGGYITNKVDFIITTGGTGIGPRDITPDVLKPMLDKEIPGIMELIRVKYGMQFPNALLSRSIAGVAGKSLIFALPGSPKAVREYIAEILPSMEHSLMMLYGIDKHGK
jgi:molybdenum cofactor synthesis domain-containing protein